MGINMAALADLRCSFELDLAGARLGFVACATGNGTVRAQ
jgi:hypothetical protein